MKKVKELFNKQPQPIKILAITALIWLCPFIESAIIQATGWYDLSLFSKILMGISAIPFGYMLWQYGIRVLIYWISQLIFKK